MMTAAPHSIRLQRARCARDSRVSTELGVSGLNIVLEEGGSMRSLRTVPVSTLPNSSRAGSSAGLKRSMPHAAVVAERHDSPVGSE